MSKRQGSRKSKGQAPTTIENDYAATTKEGSQVPVFILTISFLQVLLLYTVDNEWLMLLFEYDPYRRHELWRFLTPMLAHDGAFHLWANVIFQMILGIPLERVHGWKRMGIIYMVSILGGSLFATVLDPKSYGVGASDGGCGLLLSHLSTLILNWNEIGWKRCRIFGLLFIMASEIGGSLWIELLLAHFQQIIEFHRQQNTAGIERLIDLQQKIESYLQQNTTSHASHFGGAFAGFLISILVLRNFEKQPWKVRVQRIFKILLISAFIAFVLINFSLSFTSFYLKEEWNFNYEDSYEKHNLQLRMEKLRRFCEQDLKNLNYCIAHCKLFKEKYNHSIYTANNLSYCDILEQYSNSA